MPELMETNQQTSHSLHKMWLHTECLIVNISINISLYSADAVMSSDSSSWYG